MRLLVCGGRNYADYLRVSGVLDRLEVRPICLIHGNAPGADRMAGRWARERGILEFPFTAEWDLFGNGAGYIRNKRMLLVGKPNLVVAFPGGRGTANMIEIARRAGVEVRIAK